ncbi:hypothetical protein Bca52824_088832 [Brassica carinata]|uniref:Uncharacterized protein n=1 Tax=Brassica carinata TaxID=52824 RepID=A0A8X7PGH3_BRACI|nr:hypothetical protein Bca52824_088832 [Brassica carinata]
MERGNQRAAREYESVRKKPLGGDSVGELMTSPEYDSGKMEFSMYEVKGGLWKSGLVVLGVAIRPKH